MSRGCRDAAVEVPEILDWIERREERRVRRCSSPEGERFRERPRTETLMPSWALGDLDLDRFGRENQSGSGS